MDFEQVTNTIERLLTGRNLDGYEILLAKSRNLSIEVKEQKVDTFRCSAPLGVSVRVLKSGGMGFSYSTSLDEQDLGRMLDNAVIAAQAQTPDEFHALPQPEPYPDMADLFDEELAAVPEEAKVARAMELERLTLAADSRIGKVRKSSYGESSYEVFIRNSRGVAGQYRGTSVSSSVSAIAEEGGESQTGWDFGFSRNFADIEVKKIAQAAARKATGLLGATKIASMRCPAVFDNYVASEFLDVLASAFLAENVHKGKSLLAEKVGERLFSHLIRIRDDGTLPGGMSTAPFDAEGVRRQDTLLVDQGVMNGFLYDTFYARKEGRSSTGNATRGGVKSPSHLGVSNFFIEPGTSSPALLLAGIDRGILVTEVMGMHTANAISGDFSVGAAGYLIVNGVAVSPVKGIAIAGNIIDIFRDVEAVGDDLRFFDAVGAPSLRIGALDVSGE